MTKSCVTISFGVSLHVFFHVIIPCTSASPKYFGDAEVHGIKTYTMIVYVTPLYIYNTFASPKDIAFCKKRTMGMLSIANFVACPLYQLSRDVSISATQRNYDVHYNCVRQSSMYLCAHRRNSMHFVNRGT